MVRRIRKAKVLTMWWNRVCLPLKERERVREVYNKRELGVGNPALVTLAKGYEQCRPPSLDRQLEAACRLYSIELINVRF